MLSPAQKELLVSIIGQEGFLFEAIRDSDAFNSGVKVLYLTRAISEDCQTFLKSLDLLYNPALVGEAKDANDDFIRSLKKINDLTFNNDVKNGEHGVNKALLDTGFNKLGPYDPEIDPEIIGAAVGQEIGERINELRAVNPEQIHVETEARLAAEPNLVSQTGWRVAQDLPANQLPPVFYGAFFPAMPIAAPDIPVFIRVPAIHMGLDPQILMNYFQHDDASYSKIKNLEAYIENNHLNIKPHASLTLEEALATTRQESMNLFTAYLVVEAGLLTLNEARGLTEDERMIFCSVDSMVEKVAIYRQGREGHGNDLSP